MEEKDTRRSRNRTRVHGAWEGRLVKVRLAKGRALSLATTPLRPALRRCIGSRFAKGEACRVGAQMAVGGSPNATTQKFG